MSFYVSIVQVLLGVAILITLVVQWFQRPPC